VDLPPQNLEAERGVLGSVLLDNAAFDEVVDECSPDDFYRDAHQTVARVVWMMSGSGQVVDAITLGEELERLGKYRGVGGDDFLAELVGSVPHAANARYYAQIVRQKAITRRLVEVGTDLARKGYAGQTTAAELLRDAERQVFAVAETGRRDGTEHVAGPLWKAMDLIANRRGTVSGLRTGLGDFDVLVDGLQPEQLVILAARPSMGKSAFALNVAEKVACDDGKCVLFVSCEMNKVELSTRLLIARSRVPKFRLNDFRDLDGRDHAAVTRAYDEIAAAPLHLDDTPSRSVLQVASNARKHRAKHDLALLVVDYLQLLEPEDGRDSRQEQVAGMSRRLKTLARELHVPVLVLSQLNRALEHRDDKRPRMADLRESGGIEQDADIVALLHRPACYEPDKHPANLAELIVAKNRNGDTKTIELDWSGPFYRFSDPAAPASAF
jgi:replicative DNA helicase